jgi:hypothetical protein
VTSGHEIVPGRGALLSPAATSQAATWIPGHAEPAITRLDRTSISAATGGSEKVRWRKAIT